MAGEVVLSTFAAPPVPGSKQGLHTKNKSLLCTHPHHYIFPPLVLEPLVLLVLPAKQ